MRKVLALTVVAALVGAIAGSMVGRRTAESEHRAAMAREEAAALEFGRCLAQRISEADAVEIAYERGVGSSTVRFSDRSWVARFGKVLATSHYEPRPPCLCITFTYPAVHFLRGGERVATFTVHHGQAIRVSVVGGGVRDYHIGNTAARALSALAGERRHEAQSPEATP